MRQKRSLSRCIWASATALFSLTALAAIAPAHAGIAPSGVTTALEGTTNPPVAYAPTYADLPSANVTQEILDRRNAYEQQRDRAQATLPALRQTSGPMGPNLGTSSIQGRSLVSTSRDFDSTSDVLPLAPDSFRNFLTKGLLSPIGFNSNVSEPALAQNGKYLWVTHNWYAARSTNGGNTYTYVSPYADMPEFCCDQDAVHDERRDLFIWSRQGIFQNNQNRIRFSVSNNFASSFCSWDLYSAAGEWMDYPHMVLSDTHVYYTTNVFNGASQYVRTTIIRFNLDEMASKVNACNQGLGYQFYSQANGTWTPVQGAEERMYWGQHIDTSHLRVFWWDDNSNSINWVDRALPFTWTNSPRNTQSCPVPGGADPCRRSDNRITSGWIRRHHTGNEVGFFWNVGQGNGFAKPYVESASFTEIGLNYLARRFIWISNNTTAVNYASAAPNDRGDIGVTVGAHDPGIGPYNAVLIWDDLSATPPGWTYYVTKTPGVNWPAGQNVYGDYLRVRKFAPGGVSWIATGFTQQSVKYPNGLFYNVPQVHVTKFGRDRDNDGHVRFEKK
jgi:hypothetical protein